jgi:hypothetical protein
VIKQVVELILYKATDMQIIEHKDKSIKELKEKVSMSESEIKILKAENEILQNEVEKNI